MQFIYLTDLNGIVWLVNKQEVVRAVDISNGSMIYFKNGELLKVKYSLIELAPMLNT